MSYEFLEQTLLYFFRHSPLMLVIATRAPPKPKIKENNNFFAIILLFNNMSLPYSPPPTFVPFTPQGDTPHSLKPKV